MVFMLLAYIMMSSLFAFGTSYSVGLSSDHLNECFLVEAAKGNSCSGTFEVIQGDAAKLTVSVLGPPPKKFLHFQSKFQGGVDADKDLTEGSFQFDADITGMYTMCFAQDQDSSEEITVAFNFRSQSTNGNQDYEYAGLNAELADLQEGLDLFRDHLSYMSQREMAHKLSLGRIDVKVLCWSILEAMILIGMAIWQIGYISSFFEIKRFM